MIAAALFTLALAGLPPTPTQFVTDTQNVLSVQTVESLDAELQAYQRATGHQVIVYIGDTTGGTPLEQWTVDAAEQWGVGRKGHDDGAVLFAFMKDHKARIEVGYGLEPYLTDAQSFWIVENVIIPKMRAGDVDGAIQDAVDRMLVTITPSYASKIGHTIAALPSPSSGRGRYGWIVPLLIFLGFFWIIFIMLIVGGVRYLAAFFTKGPAAAAKAWHDTWVSSGTSHGSMLWAAPFMMGGFGGGLGGGGGFGGGFSGGGGGFGGGGASGGW